MNSQLTGESVSDEKPVVLFLCTRNSARSQIAEAWLHELAGDRFHATSAGLVPAEIHPLTNQVMQRLAFLSMNIGRNPSASFSVAWPFDT